MDQDVTKQIPFEAKKIIPRRDQDWYIIQKHMLAATGPLCVLHYMLGNGECSTLRLLEKCLCLLGSASRGLTTLRRTKVLAYITKDKVHLAKQSDPNDGRLLFGKDLGDNAKKESERFVSLHKSLNPQENQCKYSIGQSTHGGANSSSSFRGSSPYGRDVFTKKLSRSNKQKQGLSLQGDQQVRKPMNQVA